MDKVFDGKNLLILTTIVLIIVAVLNFLPVSLFLNFISVFRTQPTQETTPPTTPAPTSLNNFTPPSELAQKAAKLGYKILWIEPSDATGRTMLFSATTGNSSLVRNIGIQTFKNKQTQAPISTDIVGVFDKPVPIPNSLDYYVVIKDPTTNLAITKVRVQVGGVNPTKLYISKLDLDKDGKLATTFLGNFDTNRENVWMQKLPLILKYGDALVVTAVRTPKNAEMRDTDGYLVTLSFTLHRFNGKEEILKETDLKESDLAPKNK